MAHGKFILTNIVHRKVHLKLPWQLSVDRRFKRRLYGSGIRGGSRCWWLDSRFDGCPRAVSSRNAKTIFSQ